MEKTKLQQTALNILIQREHSRYELQQKLKKYSTDENLIEQILEFVETNHYLSEERFVEVFIRSKVNRGYGPYWIQQALISKKISQELIEKYLYSNINWNEIVHKIYLKKYGERKPKDLAEKAKRQRFLQNRGFLMEQCKLIGFSKPDKNIE